MRIILRHKGRDPWAGVVKYKNCFSVISGYLTRTGVQYTGLTKDEERRLEETMNYSEGYLSKSSSFWNSFAIKLGVKDLVLDTALPYEELQYLYLKNHKDVAYGFKNIKPNTKYVLIDKESEASELNSLNKIKRQAIREFDKMNLEEMRKCLRLFGIKSDTLSNEIVESKLFEIVEKDAKRYILKWVENPNRQTESLIEQAIAKNIIRKNKNIYYYGTDVIGNNHDDAIEYLDNKSNQDIKISILNELEVK